MEYLNNEQIETIVKAIYNIKNYSLEDDLLTLLQSKDQHILASAPAGGSKTSSGQTVIMVEQIDYLLKNQDYNRKLPKDANIYDKKLERHINNEVHCFVYNKHNVQDIKDIREDIFNVTAKTGLISNDVNKDNLIYRDISVSTLHSYALTIVKEFCYLLNIREINVKVAKTQILYSFFVKVLENVCSKKIKDEETKSKILKNEELLYEMFNLYINLNLHNYVEKIEDEELLLEKINETGYILVKELENIDLDVMTVINIFKVYLTQKKKKKIFDFNDMLVLATKILERDDIRKQIQERFKFVIIDEVQDLTQLMFVFYSKLIGPECRTLAIGDSDQTIYSFNGASPDNIHRYDELTGLNTKNYILRTNRRCRENTFHFAKECRRLIGENNFKINIQKSGGQTDLIKYENEEDEAKKIVNRIKQCKGSAAVLFRTQLGAIFLSRELFKENIHANLDGVKTFRDAHLYRIVNTVLQRLIHNTSIREDWLALRYVLGITKSEAELFFQYDNIKDSINIQPEVKYWTSLDFSSLKDIIINVDKKVNKESYNKKIVRYKNISDNLNLIKRMVEVKEKKYVSVYLPYLVDMIKNNNKYLLSKESKRLIELSERFIEEDFNAQSPLSLTLEILNKNIKSLQSHNKNSDLNLTVTTIHKSKGLEFDTVFLANLEKNKNLSLTNKDDLKEIKDELRVFYVGATRQRDSLILSVPEDENKRITFLSKDLYEKCRELSIKNEPKGKNKETGFSLDSQGIL